MLRLCAAAFCLVLVLAAPASALTLPELLKAPPAPNQSLKPVPVQGCCRHCHQGKACGDSCISRNDACHVGPGCACDG